MFLSIRNLFVVAGALVLGFLVVLPASANPSCTGGVINATFNPGLVGVLSPAQTITADSAGSTLTCSGWGTGASPTEIQVTTSSSASAECAVLPLNVSSTVMTIHWSDGTTGTAQLTSSGILQLLLTLHATLNITAGNYSGDTLNFTGNVSGDELFKLTECLVKPVHSLSANFSFNKTP